VQIAVVGAALAAAVLHVCMGCNLAGLPLSGSDFSGVVYVGGNFAGATLDRASFRGARVVAANFEKADLRGAAFEGAECTACNFDGAKLDGATFSGARMTAANFNGFAATVADVQLRELFAGCVACNFASASLVGRDLSGAMAFGMDFSKADLRGTKFDGAVLCTYVMNETQRTTKCATMQGARVDGASFLNVQLCANPEDPRTCKAIDASSLRRYSGSTLDGATLP
jgi:uncharacterized protein YjbI with pentapeptide repeats